MKPFVVGEDRRRGVLLPEYLDDWIIEENPVRAVEVFVDALDLDLGAVAFAAVLIGYFSTLKSRAPRRLKTLW